MRKLDSITGRTEEGGGNEPKYCKKVGIVQLAAPVQFVVVMAWVCVNYSTTQLLLASVIAILVAIGLFLYVPIARKVERGSIAWGLIWIAVIALGALGFISDAEPWGFPLFLLAIWARCFTACADKRRGRETIKTLATIISQVRHELCRLEEGKVRPAFFKAQQER